MKTIQEIRADFHSAFAEVSTIPGLTVSDTIQIAIAVLSEYGKDRRAEMLQNNRSNQKPTEKQLRYLKSLGVSIPDGISKQEASKLIEQAKAE